MIVESVLKTVGKQLARRAILKAGERKRLGPDANSGELDAEPTIPVRSAKNESDVMETFEVERAVEKAGSSGFRVGRSEPFRQGIEHAGQHLEPQVLLVA
jgi:hypothetical protein